MQRVGKLVADCGQVLEDLKMYIGFKSKLQ